MSFEHFCPSPSPSLGVELEFQLVDANSHALRGAADMLLDEVPKSVSKFVKPEFHACCIEVNTDVCRDVNEVNRDLNSSLPVVAQAAGRCGVLLGWGGTHPFSHWRDQSVVSDRRYLELAEHFRDTLTRQLTFGLHVHVGVPDGDTAVRVTNGMTPHIPSLLALSANSPFWCGRSTGLHSQRVEVMGALPNGGLPPRLDGWYEFVRLTERLTSLGVIQSPKDLWWDVRPSAQHGTVEVRVCDMPQGLSSVLGITALIQCLVVHLAWDDAELPRLDECGLMVVRQNRWRAARFGLEAELVDPWTGLRKQAREVIKGLIVRLWSTAEAVGCSHQLELARGMADGPDGAEQQLALYQREGDLIPVLRHMTTGLGDETRNPPAAVSDPRSRPLTTPGLRASCWPVRAIGEAARGTTPVG